MMGNGFIRSLYGLAIELIIEDIMLVLVYVVAK
jgi:hypothetical protein